MAKERIHPSNITYLIICLLGIIAFFFVGICPNFSALKEMDVEAAQLHDQLKTQEMLFPVYQGLIKEVTTKVPSQLPLPKKQKLAHNELADMNRKFSRLAQENQVTFLRATPDAANYLDDMGYLSMSVYFAGDFFKLRNLLMSICQLPWLESIDEMRIETIDNQKRMEFKIKVAQK